MYKKLRVILALVIGLSFIFSSFSALSAFADVDHGAAFSDLRDQFVANISDWTLNKGDWIVVNVEKNTLQFVSKDNKTASWVYQAGSGELLPEGQKRCYLGRCYDPRTPEGEWEILSKNQQNWQSVFGSKESDEQLFLRLYEVNGDSRERTYYGIHTTPGIEAIYDELDGFGSWGCVLTRYDLLKKIEELYHLNDEVVKVITTKKDLHEVLGEI